MRMEREASHGGGRKRHQIPNNASETSWEDGAQETSPLDPWSNGMTKSKTLQFNKDLAWAAISCSTSQLTQSSLQASTAQLPGNSPITKHAKAFPSGLLADPSASQSY